MKGTDTMTRNPMTGMVNNVMTVFRVILLAALAISFLGGIAGKPEEKKGCIGMFACSGVLFLLSVAAERLL